MKRMKAVLFNSVDRHEAFRIQFKNNNIECKLLDFSKQEWIDYDYSNTDILIYYSSFNYSSNHPHALYEVYDNLMFIHEKYPNVIMYPDPSIIKYYNDKYRQFLFLKSKNYPIPMTIPLLSMDAVDIADKELGYPMIIKNRYGAGGGAVFRVYNKKELMKYYNVSTLNLFNLDSFKYFSTKLTERIFYYWLIKAKKMIYPFLSPPLLAQKYVTIDRDLKTVIGDFKVVEAHWRLQANKDQWKVNIDGGGIGVWGKVPQEAIDLSERLAKDLNTQWLNIDMLMNDDGFMITEFSPVWHHYAYKEKPSFVYQDDYNIDMPLEESLNLEKIVVDSLVKAASNRSASL